MLKSAVLVLPLILLALGCRSGEVRVQSYWGTTIDRPAPGTVYGWAPDFNRAELSQDERIAQAIQEDVEFELAAVGFVKRAETQTPDLLVSASAGRGLQPSPSGQEQRAVLTVHVYRVGDGLLIYSASADALIEPGMSPEDRRARLDHAVHEIICPLAPPRR